MNSLYINVEIQPGTPIDMAAQDLMALAKLCGHTVCAKFNGVELLACADGSAETLAENWAIEMQSNRPHKIARS